MTNPTATIFVPYLAIEDLMTKGTRAEQPLAKDVTEGTLYSVTDEGYLIERSNGTVWEQYGPTP